MITNFQKMILAACLSAIAFPLLADDAPAPMSVPTSLRCEGFSPRWTLDVTEENGEFSFQRDSELSVQLVTTPFNQNWPRAITMIGRGDSAILLVEPGVCTNGDLTARVLTQRGETPILLVGCCQPAPN